MGLDMYLGMKNYTSRWDYSEGYDNKKNLPEFDKVQESLGASVKYLSDDCLGIETTFTVAYWRKANAIHNWFVSEIQDGEDNCGESYVSTDALRTLRDTCAQVLADKTDKTIAMEILPPTSGFFFGSTDIDEWYYEDIEFTHKRLTELLDMVAEDEKNGVYPTFVYHASW
jgi:hypothetical protein